MDDLLYVLVELFVEVGVFVWEGVGGLPFVLVLLFCLGGGCCWVELYFVEVCYDS